MVRAMVHDSWTRFRYRHCGSSFVRRALTVKKSR